MPNYQNPSDIDWKIKPDYSFLTRETEKFFYGDSSIEVPSKGEKKYTVHYSPQTMTKSSESCSKPEQHLAKLFLPLNNGSALIYNLKGVSNKPLVSQVLDKQMDTHKNEIVFLSVSNWMNENQRFEISYTSMDPEQNLNDQGLIIKGAMVVDLDAKANMEYKLSVRALKVGKFSIKVVFRNKSLDEYMWFTVNIEVLNNSPAGFLEMSSVLREKVSGIAIIENILNQPVTIPMSSIQIIGTNEIFHNLHEDIMLKANSEYAFEIFFRPLKVKEAQKAKLVIESDRLGILEYNLSLSSSMDKDKRNLRFECPLGEQNFRKFDFKNFAEKDVTFSLKIIKLDENLNQSTGTSDFFVDSPTFIAKGHKDDSSGTENTIVVKYEPSMIGLSKAFLNINSEEGGDYQILLVGVGKNPTAKGPFQISSKASTNLEFKNPLFIAKQFYLKFENPAFSSSIKGSVKIDARKSKFK